MLYQVSSVEYSWNNDSTNNSSNAQFKQASRGLKISNTQDKTKKVTYFSLRVADAAAEAAAEAVET